MTKTKFRTKFQKNFVNVGNIESIKETFERFYKLSEEEALQILWRMTYSEAEALTVLGELNLSHVIPVEKVQLLRNELRYQYQNVYPDFMRICDFSDVMNPEMIAQAQEDLFELGGKSDRIIASVILKKCKELIKEQGACSFFMDKTLYLLKNEEEKNFFGGIRCLKFDPIEADFLKPFHMYIFKLLSIMYDNMRDDILPGGENCDTDDLPFIGGESCVDESAKREVYAAERVKLEETEAELKAKTPLTAEAIIANKEIFTYFIMSNDWNRLIPIAEAGYDLNEVMEKRGKIKNLLEAANALSE